jgi:predicted helicase
LETAEEKLAFLSAGTLEHLTFEEVRPNFRNDWINLVENDFGTLISSADISTARKSTRTGTCGI